MPNPTANRTHRAQIVAEAVVSAYIHEISATPRHARAHADLRRNRDAAPRPEPEDHVSPVPSEPRHRHAIVLADLPHYRRRHARHDHAVPSIS